MTTTAPLSIGDHVHHRRLGLGRIINIEGDPHRLQAAVDYGDGIVWSLPDRLRRIDLPHLSGDPNPDLPPSPDRLDLACDFCIDGFQPAGYHDELGWVFARCLACEPECPSCHADGLFPTDQTCLACFVNELATTGQTPVLCAYCAGVVDIEPLTSPTEEIHHDH